MDIEEARTRATLTIEETSDLLRIGRRQTYEAAKNGTIPTLKMGRRLFVPVPKLLAMLGEKTESPKVQDAADFDEHGFRWEWDVYAGNDVIGHGQLPMTESQNRRLKDGAFVPSRHKDTDDATAAERARCLKIAEGFLYYPGRPVSSVELFDWYKSNVLGAIERGV